MAAFNDMELSGESIYVYRITIPSSDPNSLGFQDTIEPKPGSSQQQPFPDEFPWEVRHWLTSLLEGN